MVEYKGGNNAKGGFYWKKGEWELVTVDGKNGILPGDGECEYVKVPALVFLPLALVLGGAYVIFLPFIGFAMLFTIIGTKVGKGVQALGYAFAEKLARWRPAVARRVKRL